MKYRIIFYGTPQFSVPFLDALIKDADFDIVGVITEPDRPAGRGRRLKQSAVAEYINRLNSSRLHLNNKIAIFKPHKASDIKSEIEDLKPDVAIIVAYGQIISNEILDIPKHESINIHPSDLPKYRGPSPIQSALLNGDKSTKITIMKMDQKMDHGSILDKLNIDIDENDDYFSLEARILDLGPKFLIETLKNYISNRIEPKPQNDKKATYCSMIDKKDGLIDWTQSADKIHNKIRAYAFWPKAYTILPNNKRLLFLKTHIDSGKLKPLLVQLEGKKPTNWDDFINGHRDLLSNELTNMLS